jgi:hypothetical protein
VIWYLQKKPPITANEKQLKKYDKWAHVPTNITRKTNKILKKVKISFDRKQIQNVKKIQIRNTNDRISLSCKYAIYLLFFIFTSTKHGENEVSA